MKGFRRISILRSIIQVAGLPHPFVQNEIQWEDFTSQERCNDLDKDILLSVPKSLVRIAMKLV